MNGQETAPAKPAGRVNGHFAKGECAGSRAVGLHAARAAIGTNNSNELRLNFRNAPLEMVLNYLSDAAGFIIVLDTHVNGNVTIVSTHPVSQDEAVNLLNTELNRNDYAAIRNGRTLTIVDKSDAKTRNIPVKTGNIPNSIPDNDKMQRGSFPSGLWRRSNWSRICRRWFRRRRRLSPTRPAIRLWSPTRSPTSGIWPKSSSRWTTAPRRRQQYVVERGKKCGRGVWPE